MKKDQDYISDIAEIRSMMERSSKFLSLSGWAGIMAGIYSLAGAYVAYRIMGADPGDVSTTYANVNISSKIPQLIALAAIVLILAVGTAVYFSGKRAGKRSEKLWNPTSKRLLTAMAVPLVAGGILILILLANGIVGLAAPLTLIFYGLALYGAGKFTYPEIKSLGIIEICLGLIGAYFIGYGLIIWALGFGVFHIAYGIYMHFKYER
ncbi:MAG TPA: hypothetical protein VJ911_10845 [Cryomorphaceae bacterium]|nr:hypothetical protein [Cryomorphaceae bacterium]